MIYFLLLTNLISSLLFINCNFSTARKRGQTISTLEDSSDDEAKQIRQKPEPKEKVDFNARYQLESGG